MREFAAPLKSTGTRKSVEGEECYTQAREGVRRCCKLTTFSPNSMEVSLQRTRVRHDCLLIERGCPSNQTRFAVSSRRTRSQRLVPECVTITCSKAQVVNFDTQARRQWLERIWAECMKTRELYMTTVYKESSNLYIATAQWSLNSLELSRENDC